MAELNTKKVNAKEINEGGWVGKQYGTPIPGWDDLCLKVRGTNSEAYRHAKAVKATGLKQDDMDPETGGVKVSVADRNFYEVLHEVVLLDWQNLTAGGKELKYSADAARALLMDPDNEPFREAVINAAARIGEIRAAAEAKIVKN